LFSNLRVAILVPHLFHVRNTFLKLFYRGISYELDEPRFGHRGTLSILPEAMNRNSQETIESNSFKL